MDIVTEDKANTLVGKFSRESWPSSIFRQIRHYVLRSPFSTKIWYHVGLVFFFALFLLSLVHRGFTWDEGVHFDSTLWQIDYARSVLMGETSPRAGIVLTSFHQIFNDYAYYGLGALGPAYFISYFIDTQILGEPHVWYRSFSGSLHLLAFIYALLCVEFSRKLVKAASGHASVGYLAAVAVMLTPWWLGYSLFDYKDIPIASALIINLYYSYVYVKNNDPRVIPYFFVALFLLAAQRVAALPLAAPACLAVLLGTLVNCTTRKVITVIASGLICLLMLYLISPPAWREPFDFVLSSVKVMSNHPWEGCTLTAGKCIGRNHAGGVGYSAAIYLLIWYGVQLPILWWIGLVVALFLFGRTLLTAFSKLRLVDFLIPAAFIWPILAIIANNATLYNGIRHTVFLLPLLISFIFTTISRELIIKMKYCFGIYLLLFSADIVYMRPYSYIWFNEVARFVADSSNFSTDYWGFALRQMSLRAVSLQQADEWVVGFPTVLVEPDIDKRMAKIGNNFSNIPRGMRYLLVSISNFDLGGCKQIDNVSRRELFTPRTLQLAFLLRCDPGHQK